MSAKLTLEFEIEPSDLEALARLVEIEDIPAKKLLKGSKEELCKKYNEYKVFIPVVLPFIKKIPVYGSKIATVIETLMQIADFACAI